MSLPLELRAARIARQLKAAEQQTDRAMLENCRLMTEILETRQDLDLEPSVAQQALIRLARAQTSVVESSNDLMRVHQVLFDTGREMGIFEEKKNMAALISGLTENVAA